MDRESLPQYTRIAMEIASRIAAGEYQEGARLSGRSVLSSEFKVSPETVRKALRILADLDIVTVREGSAARVRSAARAREYLQSLEIRREREDLRSQLRALLKNYASTGREMLEIADRLINASAIPLPSEQALPNYEAEIPDTSDKIGMTIGDLGFWQCTGATIVAIRRGQHIDISPGPYYELQAGDVLIYVGSPGCKEAVERLLCGGGTDSTLYRIQSRIVTAIHAKELSVIAEALGARMGDITDFTTLTKGMTNRSYLFSCKGKRYILRIPGEGTGALINRRQEAAVYKTIAGLGLCDDVVYLNPENGLKVTEFLEGVRSADPYREEDLKRVIPLLRRFHEMDLQVDHEFRLYEQLEFYESLWQGKPSLYPDYGETKANILFLREFIEKHRGKMCLSHIDAVPDNFLFYIRDGKEQLQLTDWEYAGMQDPHVDIAMFCIYSGYDRAQVDHLIDLYFEGSCDRTTRLKIYCYVAVCGLLWSNWCEYKHQLGVEFGEYALSQYNYARDFYKIAREELSRL